MTLRLCMGTADRTKRIRHGSRRDGILNLRTRGGYSDLVRGLGVETLCAAHTSEHMTQNALFPLAVTSPVNGYVYEPDFLSEAEEAALILQIRTLPLEEAEDKQFRAKRRIKGYGGRYDFSANRLLEAEPIAPFLRPLRERVADWTARPAEDFTHALVAEYASGTQLGWHRDVPNFELVVGVSLGSACRMRLRRYPPKTRERSIAVELAPRSIYRLEGEARWEWQHRIPPTPGLRHSITFRTLTVKLT
jgi:alkylated DNA repair dioxygenase AlkB